MGLEAKCVGHFGKGSGEGKAHLGSQALLFRGPFRLEIPFAEIKSVEAREGVLTVRFGRTAARFELGAAAEKWATRIRNPKSLIEKLGVKSNARVSVVGLRDAAFVRELRARGARVSAGKAVRDSDLIFLGVHAPEDLNRFPELRRHLRSAGALWAVWAKGKGHLVGQLEVLVACRLARLADVTVVSFSETHSAVKMVIPVEERP